MKQQKFQTVVAMPKSGNFTTTVPAKSSASSAAMHSDAKIYMDNAKQRDRAVGAVVKGLGNGLKEAAQSVSDNNEEENSFLQLAGEVGLNALGIPTPGQDKSLFDGFQRGIWLQHSDAFFKRYGAKNFIGSDQESIDNQVVAYMKDVCIREGCIDYNGNPSLEMCLHPEIKKDIQILEKSTIGTTTPIYDLLKEQQCKPNNQPEACEKNQKKAQNNKQDKDGPGKGGGIAWAGPDHRDMGDGKPMLA